MRQAIKYKALAAAALAASIGMVLTGIPGAAVAQDQAKASFTGEQITIYVGFNPGGAYDLYARLAGDYIGKHLEGNPEVIVVNMPGAGGRRAAQFIQSVAPQDGTALLLVMQSIAAECVAETIPDLEGGCEFNAVGRLATDVEMGVTSRSSGVASIEELKTNEVQVGSTGVGSLTYIIPTLLNDVLGTKYDVILGYEGAGNIRLALSTGEVDGMMSSLVQIKSFVPEWLEEDSPVNFVWQLATEPHPEFPNVQAIGQLGETEDERALFRLMAGSADVGRSLITTPNVPQERLDALRDAFSAMLTDPEFQSAAQERKLPLDTLTGEELQAVLVDQIDVPEGAAAMAKNLLAPK